MPSSSFHRHSRSRSAVINSRLSPRILGRNSEQDHIDCLMIRRQGCPVPHGRPKSAMIKFCANSGWASRACPMSDLMLRLIPCPMMSEGRYFAAFQACRLAGSLLGPRLNLCRTVSRLLNAI